MKLPMIIAATMAAILGARALDGVAQDGSERPRELGDVKWERDLGVALDRARKEKRDVFVLFQEVPG